MHQKIIVVFTMTVGDQTETSQMDIAGDGINNGWTLAQLEQADAVNAVRDVMWFRNGFEVQKVSESEWNVTVKTTDLDDKVVNVKAEIEQRINMPFQIEIEEPNSDSFTRCHMATLKQAQFHVTDVHNYEYDDSFKTSTIHILERDETGSFINHWISRQDSESIVIALSEK